MSTFYDTIARYYDAENAEMTDDLALYSELAEEYGGPILDVGCGTGRVMLHLAQEGYDCVGIDTSAAMLARARRKVIPSLAKHVELIEGDVMAHEALGHYRMILLAYHAFMHFETQEQQLTLLKLLARNLAEEGVIVFDLPNAGIAFNSLDDQTITLERTFIEPESGHLVMQQSVSIIDRVTQHLYVTWIYDEMFENGTVHRTLAPLTLRYVFNNELQLLLAASGLRCQEVYGDYDRLPLIDGCPKLIALAVKQSIP